jgi:hypothetical protein
VSQANVVVTAAIASGTGTLGGTLTARTNASGVATFTGLTISGLGAHTLRFSAPGLGQATSSAITVNPGAASKLTITTQPSSTVQNGVALAQNPVIQVRDAGNNAIAQAGVVVTAAIGSGGGALSGTTTATTDASGVATFTNLVITGTAGARTLSFSAPSLTSITSSSINVTAGAASQIAITTQPSTAASSGAVFATQPVVRLRDASGNNVSQSGVTITASIASGTGTLGGTATASTNTSGVATFTNLSITSAAGAFTLRFASGSLTPATSGTITISVPTPPTQLGITTQPSSSATTGIAFATQPVIQLRDASNNAVAQSGVVITAAIATGGGTLGGTTTATTNASGVASFGNLSIAGTAGSRTLSFSATGLTGVTSSAIAVSDPPPSGEPVYSPGVSTLVFQDNMDEYTDVVAMGAVSSSTTPRITPHPSPITNSEPVKSGSQLITGRGGTGKALRLAYSGANQEEQQFITLNMPSTADLTTHYLQYWARVSTSAASSVIPVKWFELWHTSGRDRIQFNTHDPLPCTGTYRTYWQVYDQSRETTCQGNQPVGPYFATIADGQWHRFTYSYRPNSAAGARDGFARMWVDGVKIIDVSAATIGVTPPGGTKPWCLADDVDALAVNDGIHELWWGSTQTLPSSAWTYDIDDLIWWR